MKKLLALILAFTCLLGLTACGEKLEEPTELNLKFSSGETLEAPPNLRIVSTDGTVTASGGNYDWTVQNAFGTATSTIACGAHPLDCQNVVDTLTTDDDAVKLDFAVRGDYVSAVECWSDAYWGNMDAQSEIAELKSNNDDLYVTLKPGGWVYRVSVEWDRDRYSGACDYVFHVICNE